MGPCLVAQFTRERLEERGVALPNESTWSLCARAVPIASNVESRIFFRPPRIDCQLKLRLQTNLQSFYESWFNTETNRHSSSQLELVLLIPRKQTKSMPLTGRFSTYDRLPGHWSQNASCRVTRYIHDWVLRRKNCTRMKEGADKIIHDNANGKKEYDIFGKQRLQSVLWVEPHSRSLPFRVHLPPDLNLN